MPKEILIAGSDITDQEEFQKVFETTDYHLVFSDKAEDALLRIKLFKPDLIIASTALSGKGGLEFCESIKVDPEFREIPVILVSGILEEISERDRVRAKADGIISKPLHEGEVLNLVDELIERGTLTFAESAFGKEWNVSKEAGGNSPGKTGELFLNQLGETAEEEIIELVDIVEEPEPRMSIDDFITAKEKESYEEVPNLEPEQKITEEQEKTYGDLDFLTFNEKEIEAKVETVEAAKKERGEKEGRPAPFEKESSTDEEIFEKIDLDEILAKVERIQPSIEKEWPQEKETEEISPEKLFRLDDFETALKGEVRDEERPADLKPFSFEKPKREAPAETAPEELLVEEEELKEVAEEEFPDELFEEMLEEEEIEDLGELKEEEAVIEKPVIEAPRESAEVAFDMFEEKMEPAPKPDLQPEAPKEEFEIFEAMEAQQISQEVVSPMVKTVEKQLEEVVAKGVQDMIGDFISKILPEMTHSIMNLTAERIEKMVKEIVPDLAEKVIQEEIKRLQKEEKD